MARRCMYCETTERELRPYGPGGRDVCFSCAMAPERKAQTEAACLRALSGPEPLVLDAREQAGPRPLLPAERDAIAVHACSVCGAPEVEARGPTTRYACGGSDYDRRPETVQCPSTQA